MHFPRRAPVVIGKVTGGEKMPPGWTNRKKHGRRKSVATMKLGGTVCPGKKRNGVPGKKKTLKKPRKGKLFEKNMRGILQGKT